jgi:hypothetical protein
VQNHDQKARDMARSVLPSTRRRSARAAKRELTRRERGQVRAALHHGLRNRQLGDLDVTVDLRRHRLEVVWERRSADKIGPLTRWAERLVDTRADLREAEHADRVEYFRALLPSNKIGRHALSHLEWAVGTPPRWVGRIAGCGTTDSRPDALRSAVSTVVAAGAHGELNRSIKRTISPWLKHTGRTAAGRVTWLEWQGWVLLHGAGDIDRFVAAARGRSEAAAAVNLATEIRRGSSWRSAPPLD